MVREIERRWEGIDSDRPKLVKLLNAVYFLVVSLDVRHTFRSANE